MRIISRRTAAATALVVVLTGGGVAYAASTSPSNQDAQDAVKVLQDYVNAQASASPAPTVTVTETTTATVTAPPVTATVTVPPVTTTVTAPPVTVTVTGSPSTTTPSPSTTTPSPSTTTPTTGPTFTPASAWAWVDGSPLGPTDTSDQWASAKVYGLKGSSEYNAGFRVRWDGSGTGIWAGISGTYWKVEGGGYGQTTGAISTPADGALLRVQVQGNTLTISVNGAVVKTLSISGSNPGLRIVPSAWQEAVSISMRDIQFGDVTGPPPTSTVTTPPSSTTPPAGAKWLSGASSVYAVNGTYGTWRGEPVTIVGTWSDGDSAGSQSVGSIGPGTDLAGLNSSFALDIAIGAIFDGQTWAQAATGAYNQAWLNTLNNLKSKTQASGVRPENIYIRFAHEYNGDWTDWKVAKGQEANFRNAIARFSTLRYDVFGTTNAPKVVLCSNEGTSGGMADPRDEFVKNDGLGRPVVDVYCTDFYNAWPFRTDATQIRNWLNRVDGGIPDSPEEHRRFAESQGVPFSVGEWSNCGVASQCSQGGGESPNFMVEINRWFREHAGSLSNPAPGQLLYEIQFNLWSQYAIYGSEAHQPQTAAKYAEQVWGQ